MLAAVDRGVTACKRGDWREGLAILGAIAAEEGSSQELPANFYSYLGHGIARFEGRRREGLALCKHAVRLERSRGEHYFHLAQIYLMAENRSAAVRVVFEGLAADPRSQRLQWLSEELGIRRRPVLPFLGRSNPVNIWLGRWRHRLLKKE